LAAAAIPEQQHFFTYPTIGSAIHTSTCCRYLAASANGHTKCKRKSPVLARPQKTRYLLKKPNQPSSTLPNTERSKKRSMYQDSITDSPMTVASPSAVGDCSTMAITA
jgi:hypothetical protein